MGYFKKEAQTMDARASPSHVERVGDGQGNHHLGLSYHLNRITQRKEGLMEPIRQLLTRLGVMAAHPGAFAVLIFYAALWYIFDRDTLDWHAVATLSVWFMTLLIQRAEHRDTQALQAKIDELLHAQRGADSSLTRIDEEEPEEIERHRSQARTKD